MLKKSFKIFLIMLMFLPSIIMFNGCTIGVCTLTFETWGGSGPSDIIMSPGEELDFRKFYNATKTGYNFDCWCYDAELTRPISFPMIAAHGTYTYYAKYNLDEEYFISSNNYITWSNNNQNTYLDYSLSSYSQQNIMLNKLNTNYILESIIIEPTDPTPGQGFMVSNFEVYDEQGKIVEDKNEDKYIFEPKTSKSNMEIYKYVLRIKADFKGGNFKIKINGKNT